MIRILLVIFVPLFAPTAIFILWRTFAPPRWGGSEAIANDRWEPLPWKWLMIGGGVLTAIALMLVVLFPSFFGGAELTGRPLHEP
jgi:hypothetical protein